MLTKNTFNAIITKSPAGVAELADALDSGSNGRKAVQVQVLSPAPKECRKKSIVAKQSTSFALCDRIRL